MKKLIFLSSLITLFFLTESFASQPSVGLEKNPDWLIRIEKSGISVINDGRTCIELTVDVTDFSGSWTNCP